jgi:hypothetical protein
LLRRMSSEVMLCTAPRHESAKDMGAV